MEGSFIGTTVVAILWLAGVVLVALFAVHLLILMAKFALFL